MTWLIAPRLTVSQELLRWKQVARQYFKLKTWLTSVWCAEISRPPDPAEQEEDVALGEASKEQP